MAPKRYKSQQRRLKPKRSLLTKVFRNRFFWFGIFGLLAMAAIVYGIFFTPLFQIQTIEITGTTEKVSAEHVDLIAREYAQKKVLFFALDNILLADVKRIANEIYAEFPNVEDLSIQRKFPNRIKIEISERKGVSVWCQKRNLVVETFNASSSEPEASGQQEAKLYQQCFKLDRNGIIFEEMPVDRESLPAGSVGRNSEITLSSNITEAALGDKVIEPDLLTTVLRFENDMNSTDVFLEFGLRVLTAHIVSEERANAKISEGWELYFNPANDMNWQVTKVKLVLDEEIPQEKRALLEYIDIRFGDQAYIKYRD